jgi:hypothetical protein
MLQDVQCTAGLSSNHSRKDRAPSRSNPYIISSSPPVQQRAGDWWTISQEAEGDVTGQVARMWRADRMSSSIAGCN